VGLVIVRDHDGVCDCLGNDIIHMVFDCENDLETELFILVPAVACNSHWKLDLHCSSGNNWRRGISIAWHGMLGGFRPIFDLVGVEDDDSLLLVLLKQLVFLGFSLLLSKRALPFTLYASSTDFHLPAIQGLVIFW
jgi:hypothetical protein